MERRRYVVVRQDDILTTVRDPERVVWDADHENRENFYRIIADHGTPRPLFLKVCVEFDRSGGTIITAHPHAQVEANGATEMAAVDLSMFAEFHWPSVTALNPADMLFGYDAVADSLAVVFGGTVRPAYLEPLDMSPADYVSLRLDFDTDEVVGVEIEAVRIRALHDYPDWRPIVEAGTGDPVWRRVDSKLWPALTALVAEIVDLSNEHSTTFASRKERELAHRR